MSDGTPYYEIGSGIVPRTVATAIMEAIDYAREADDMQAAVIQAIEGYGGAIALPDIFAELPEEAERILYGDMAEAIIVALIHVQVLSEHSRWMPFINLRDRRLTIAPMEILEDWMRFQRERKIQKHLDGRIN